MMIQHEGSPRCHSMWKFFLKKIHLTKQEQIEILADMLTSNQDVFTNNDTDIGRRHLTEHKIEMGNVLLWKLAPHRIPLAFIREEELAVQKLVDQGIVHPLTSWWTSPLAFIEKKNGQVWPCIGHRRLNDVTIKDAFPLPNIQDCFDTAAPGATPVSSIDIIQRISKCPSESRILVKLHSSKNTGLFEFFMILVGLCNAPATYQTVLELACRGL